MKKIILIPLLLTILLIIIGIWYSISMRDFDGQSHESQKYDNLITSTIKNSATKIDLKTIFKFNWEYIYIVPRRDFNSEDLFNRLEIEFELKRIPPSYNDFSRVLFISNNTVIYDYTVSSDIIIFQPLDKVITKENSNFEVVSSDSPIILKCIQNEF